MTFDNYLRLYIDWLVGAGVCDKYSYVCFVFLCCIYNKCDYSLFYFEKEIIKWGNKNIWSDDHNTICTSYLQLITSVEATQKSTIFLYPFTY